MVAGGGSDQQQQAAVVEVLVGGSTRSLQLRVVKMPEIVGMITKKVVADATGSRLWAAAGWQQALLQHGSCCLLIYFFWAGWQSSREVCSNRRSVVCLLYNVNT